MFGLVPFAKNIAKSNDDFNKLFDVFNEPFFHEPFAKMNSYVKSFKVDVKDTDKAYELTAELPGIAKENISLDYNKGYLTIKTTTTKSTEEKPAENANDKNEKPQEKYIRRERYVGEMQRSFYIDDIDEKNIQKLIDLRSYYKITGRHPGHKMYNPDDEMLHKKENWLC